jgi:8-oxo-dGTP pyrophosphatase MutT (NUDIX family)
MSITNYASYLGTNWNTSLLRLLSNEKTLDRSYISDCLGVGGVVLTSDDYIVLIRRGAHVAEYPNCVDVPGGHPEPSRVDGCGGPAWEYAPEEKEKEESKEKKFAGPSSSTAVSSKALVDEFYQSVLEEIYEEVNIPLSKMQDNRLLSIIRQTAAGGKPSGIFQISCALTSDEVKQLYAQGPPDAEETTDLVLMTAASVREMGVEDMRKMMCPACVASLVTWKYFLTRKL